MKNIFTLALLATCLFSLSVFSQNYVAQYNFVSNGGFAVVFSSTLYLPENGNKSFLIDYTQRKEVEEKEETIDLDADGNWIY